MGLHLVFPQAAVADGAGHLGVALGAEDYSDEYFEGGRSGNRITWSPGVTGKYMWSDDQGTLPTMGVALSRWEHEVEGDCCGFENEHIQVSVTALDLLWGNLTTTPNGGYEALYVFFGVSTIDNETEFDNQAAAGVPGGTEQASQFGVGFFAGQDGGFSGGFELRHAMASDYDSFRYQITFGYGF